MHCDSFGFYRGNVTCVLGDSEPKSYYLTTKISQWKKEGCKIFLLTTEESDNVFAENFDVKIAVNSTENIPAVWNILHEVTEEALANSKRSIIIIHIKYLTDEVIMQCVKLRRSPQIHVILTNSECEINNPLGNSNIATQLDRVILCDVNYIHVLESRFEEPVIEEIMEYLQLWHTETSESNIAVIHPHYKQITSIVDSLSGTDRITAIKVCLEFFLQHRKDWNELINLWAPRLSSLLWSEYE